MKLLRRRFLCLAAGAAAFSAVSRISRAQTYPARLIKIIVPFPAGGPTDFLARLMAEKLSISLGRSVIVDNRPGGAGGTVGVRAAAIAEPDGYTLLLANVGTLTIAPSIYKNLDFDPIKSFAPISLLTTSPQVLVVNPALPVTTMQELVVYAKNNPGKISFASPGVGLQPHLLGELLKYSAHIEILHVPYRGAAPAITDLLAGQVQMYFETSTVLLPHIEAGKLRPLAVASATRSPELPEVPTATESGFPTVQGTLWSGMLAPAGTQASVVNKLNSAINDILKAEDMQARLKTLGAEAKGGSPQEFTVFLSAELQKWAAVVAAANIKVD
jgi:tripartite-type tricarboxylate transporter receptor subunit TctC